MQGVVINVREAMTAESREPPLIVRQQLTIGLQMAFDALPDAEKPENKATRGLVRRIRATQMQPGQPISQLGLL